MAYSEVLPAIQRKVLDGASSAITVMGPSKPWGNFEAEAAWSHEAVGEQLTPFFADKEPVKDSFIPEPIF